MLNIFLYLHHRQRPGPSKSQDPRNRCSKISLKDKQNRQKERARDGEKEIAGQIEQGKDRDGQFLSLIRSKSLRIIQQTFLTFFFGTPLLSRGELKAPLRFCCWSRHEFRIYFLYTYIFLLFISFPFFFIHFPCRLKSKVCSL